MISLEDRERERALFESERKRVPELFDRAPMIDDAAALRSIGIDEDASEKPLGYLRLMPQDFIVEEIDESGAVHDVDCGVLHGEGDSEGGTFYADLVKIGISTLEAKHQLATLLGIDEKHIGFAGIKDRLALTSQKISIRSVVDAHTLEHAVADNFFLKQIRQGKGAVANGELKGNRFTITLRSPHAITAEEQERIREQASVIETEGFWNFFSFQRFGTPRLLSHRLGLLIVRQEYEQVIKLFVTETTDRELPYFKNIRTELADMWGDWVRMRDRMRSFPYHFSLELTMIEHLVGRPSDFLGALHTIPDQIRLWIYAYDCSLFNRKLSELIREGTVPMQLPLVTSFSPMDWEPYQAFLDADRVVMPSKAYRDFPFVRVASRTWPVLQRITTHGLAFDGQIAVFSFSLPKGSYATTYLNNFFTLASGLPTPPGISNTEVDARELLGTGTLKPTLERFAVVLQERKKDVEGSPEGE